MALIDLSNIKRIFGGKQDAQASIEVRRELMLMVLARATDADAYTDPVEVEAVQKVLEEQLGEPIASSDVRIAASSKLFETAPLEKYISRVGRQLAKPDRVVIINALIDVLKADERVATSEVSYFNMVASALDLDFADVAGLSSD